MLKTWTGACQQICLGSGSIANDLERFAKRLRAGNEATVMIAIISQSELTVLRCRARGISGSCIQKVEHKVLDSPFTIRGEYMLQEIECVGMRWIKRVGVSPISRGQPQRFAIALQKGAIKLFCQINQV